MGLPRADQRRCPPAAPGPSPTATRPALRGADGWLATKDHLAEYAVEEDQEALRQKLVVDTKIASDAVAFTSPTYSLRGSHDAVYDEKFPETVVLQSRLLR